MTVSPKDSRLMLLISSVLIVIPMVIFPAKLGTELSSGSFTYAFFEVLYYGVIFFILRPGSSLLQLFQGAGLTFLCRIVIGTIFGIMISIMYDVGLSASLTLGVSKYLPAIILHIAFVPIITKPVYYAILGEPSGDELRRDKKKQVAFQSQTSATTPSQIIVQPKPVVARKTAVEEPIAAVSVDKSTDGFARAVKYIGEHQSVKMAAVVDDEGLTLSSFSRDGVDIEEWAPLALLFKEANREILRRLTDAAEPERLDLTFDQNKLFALKVSQFTLLVLSNREDDDLLSIRLVQASDIIGKYISERYDELLTASPEEKYVSST
ncbi:MAG: hypothetical protein DRP51_00075 [Candidatus Zixiibacteriota bacterium]|nr:MAG: hypothetical protein DRP51_00075 [candidate division Zixibacteria bacterium]